MQPDNLGPLALSLAKAQAAFPAIPRTREVKVVTKTGQTYTFKYAPLDTIIELVRPPLSANGLAIAQLLDGEDLVTLLLHESGAVLEGRVTLPRNPGDNVQQLGSAITYLRRYALQAILGIASEEDDDGNAAAGNRAQATTRPPKRDRVQDAIDAEEAAAEAYRQNGAARTPQAAPSVPQAGIDALHAQFTPVDAAKAVWTPDELVDIEQIAPTGGMTIAELFQAAEDAGIPKARLTVTAKTLYGVNRWKIADLSNEERAGIWAEIAPVPA